MAFPLVATQNFLVGSASGSSVSAYSIQVYNASDSPAWDGSIVLQGRTPDGVLHDIPYLVIETDTVETAGTAITDPGFYEVSSNGVELVIVYTHVDGSATLLAKPLQGSSRVPPGSGGGGGGGDVNLTEVGGASISEGQKTMANSLPTVIASDQSKIPVQITDGTTDALVDFTSKGAYVAFVADLTPAATTPLPTQAFDATLTNGQAVLAASTAAVATDKPAVVAVHPSSPLPAGELHLGAIGGNTAVLKPTFTVSTTPAYTAGDDIGGKVTIANAVRVSGGTGVFQSLQLLFKSGTAPTGTFLLFDADPTNATITDNAAFVWSTDQSKLIGTIPVVAGDLVTVGSQIIAKPTFTPFPIKAASGTSLYCAYIGTGTPTFTATTDMVAVLGILQD